MKRKKKRKIKGKEVHLKTNQSTRDRRCHTRMSGSENVPEKEKEKAMRMRTVKENAMAIHSSIHLVNATFFLASETFSFSAVRSLDLFAHHNATMRHFEKTRSKPYRDFHTIRLHCFSRRHHPNATSSDWLFLLRLHLLSVCGNAFNCWSEFQAGSNSSRMWRDGEASSIFKRPSDSK